MLSLWAKENAVWPPFTKYFDAPPRRPSVRTDTGHDADGEHVEGHHGTCKLAALRGGTDVARTHMATESVLALCAVLERAAARLSDLPIAAKYKSYTGVHLTFRFTYDDSVCSALTLTPSDASPCIPPAHTGHTESEGGQSKPVGQWKRDVSTLYYVF